MIAQTVTVTANSAAANGAADRLQVHDRPCDRRPRRLRHGIGNEGLDLTVTRSSSGGTEQWRQQWRQRQQCDGGGGGSGDFDIGVATFVVANGWSAADVGVASVLAARTSGAVVVYTAGEALSDKRLRC